jgi:hypothetical protein
VFCEDLTNDIFQHGVPLFHSALGLDLAEDTAMTPSKNHFSLSRTPAYVDRKIGAAELRISESTWDRYVETGIIPPPAPGFPPDTPRWRWEDVDNRLARKAAVGADRMIAAAARFKV